MAIDSERYRNKKEVGNWTNIKICPIECIWLSLNNTMLLLWNDYTLTIAFNQRKGLSGCQAQERKIIGGNQVGTVLLLTAGNVANYKNYYLYICFTKIILFS